MIVSKQTPAPIWRFADCQFDEGNWLLSVGGISVPVETKPLELLKVLLANQGQLVTREELICVVWPGINVVDASLNIAIHKLRQALKDDSRSLHLIETVPRRGYRLAPWVEVSRAEVSKASSLARLASTLRSTTPHALSIALMSVLFLIGAQAWRSPLSSNNLQTRIPTQREARSALRRLDVEKIDALIASGWDPNKPFDDQGNGALNIALEICEWDPSHDRQRLLLTARSLMDGGVRLNQRNVWGDTPYSIARAGRYCGENHPVTIAIRNLCLDKNRKLLEGCQASYVISPTRTKDSYQVGFTMWRNG